MLTLQNQGDIKRETFNTGSMLPAPYEINLHPGIAPRTLRQWLAPASGGLERFVERGFVCRRMRNQGQAAAH